MSIWSGSIWSSGAENFSYETIEKNVTVPATQQMVVHEEIRVENGNLICEGTIILEP